MSSEQTLNGVVNETRSDELLNCSLKHAMRAQHALSSRQVALHSERCVNRYGAELADSPRNFYYNYSHSLS